MKDNNAQSADNNSSNHSVLETVAEVVTHIVAHEVAGPVGGFFAALLFPDTLYAPEPERIEPSESYEPNRDGYQP